MFIKLDHNDIKILLDMFNDYESTDLQADELQVKKKLELILMKQTAKFERIKSSNGDIS